MTQSELARRVDLRQSTINGLIRGEARSSKHLHRIARELRTTAAYLSGETDDPDEGAPPPPPPSTIQLVPMAVALPAEDALTDMFRALLANAPEQASQDELARTLAELLPIGLGQLQGQLLRRSLVGGDELRSRPGAERDDDPAPRRASSK